MLIVGKIEKINTCEICGKELEPDNKYGLCFQCFHKAIMETEYGQKMKEKKQKKESRGILVERLKHIDNRPFGVMVANHIDGKVRIGISLCNEFVDTFNKKIGTELALKRTICLEPYVLNISAYRITNDIRGDKWIKENNSILIKAAIFDFMDRANRYFKGINVIYPTNMVLV